MAMPYPPVGLEPRKTVTTFDLEKSTLGHHDAIGKCVATATDDAQCLAMLVRRDSETLYKLLRRLDAAIADAYENDRIIDEINVPAGARSRKTQR